MITDKPSISQDIPINYLWFGETVPEDYLISLRDVTYPVVFLKDPLIDRNFSRELLNIEKSDYYRLQHLYEYGGIYSDFDNIIDYPCLMKALQPYRTQDKLVFMADARGIQPVETRQGIPNHLIYAPQPKMPILKEMLDKIDDKKPRIWEFARSKFFGQFKEAVEVNLSKCVKHLFDWSWYQESNLVLNKKAPGKPQFLKKRHTKKKIIQTNNKIESQIKNQRQRAVPLSNQITKLNQQKDRLMKEILENFQNHINQQNKFNAQQQGGNQLWQSERNHLQSKIFKLQAQKSQLQKDKNLRISIFGGILVFITILMILLILAIKKKKCLPYSNFNTLGSQMVEQNKFSPK